MSDNGVITWNTEIRRLGDLIPWEDNPRQLTKEQAGRLERSLKKFGYSQLVEIEPDDTFLDGHQRDDLMKIMTEFGPDAQIECRVANRKFSLEERKEYIALKHEGATGEWNWEGMHNLYDFDELIDYGFDKEELIKFGFMPEEDLLDDPGAQIDLAEELREKWGVESGQLWRLGEHRLICGDCTDAEILDRLMQGEKAGFCFTSPPYWVGKEYETQDSIEAIDEFIGKVCHSMNLAIRKDQSRIVINTGTGYTTSFEKKKKRQVLLLIDKWTNGLYDLGWNLRHIRHWLKHGQLVSTSPKTDLIDQHSEFLIAFEYDDGEDINFDDLLDETEVEILCTFYNTSGKSRGQNRIGRNGAKWALRSYWNDLHGAANKTDGHVAAFPLELPERHLLMYSQKGDRVFDPFIGSGTTIIACERFERQCRAIDLEPKYCAVAIQRWVDMTSGEPELIDA